MGTFPKKSSPIDPLITVAPFMPCSMGGVVSVLGQRSSQGFGAAPYSVFMPFRISRMYKFSSMFIYNGSVTSGNIDLGVFSEDGTLLVSTGSTAQGAVATVQKISVSETILTTGLYYMGLSCDNTSSKFYSQNSGIQFNVLIGAAEMANQFPLPANITFATYSNNWVPMMGLTGRSFV